jgi:hypothetical protein
MTHLSGGDSGRCLNRFQGGDRGTRDCLKDISKYDLDQKEKE